MGYQTKKSFSLFILLTTFVFGCSQVSVDQDRLERRIFDLAKFGLRENGKTERVAFSDANVLLKFPVGIRQKDELNLSPHFLLNV